MFKKTETHRISYGHIAFLFLVICFGILSIFVPYSTDLNRLQADASEVQPNETIRIKELVTLSPNKSENDSFDFQRRILSELKEDAPAWPMSVFLRGEAYQRGGELTKARECYRALTVWAAGDPYKDGWGGSGLVGAALWRWAKLLAEAPNPDSGEVGALLDAAAKLRETRLVKSIHKASILGSLPQIDEELSRRLMLLAWSSGRQDAALKLFPAYLAIACKVNLSEAEKKMMDQLSTSGGISQGQFNLLQGKCMQSRGNSSQAIDFFNKAYQSEDVAIRTEAGLLTAQIRAKGDLGLAERQDLANLLESVSKEATDRDLAQRALYDRAFLYNRKGPGKNVQQFLQGLLQVVEEFPTGPLTDDALYRLAGYYEDQDNLDQALLYYEQLRNFEGPNDWSNLGAFKPAMALYTRANPGDLAKAEAILRELEERNPFGPLHLAALFWLGRMAEESGDKEGAAVCFRKIIEESPYNYYALRARMHLRPGRSASKQLWPDAEIKNEFYTAYRSKNDNSSLQEASPYHARIRNALETGLYSQALAGNHRLRELFPDQRLEDLSLDDLDRAGLLTHMVLLTALRQDVFAAKDRVPEPRNRLQLAGMVENKAKDWPLAMRLITATDESVEVRANAQQDKLYLSVAYPVVFKDLIEKSALRYDVRPELLYGVMRNESLFNPDALSPSNALGLFQFIPSTFRALDHRWNLLKESGAASREAFLLDPRSNIELGARWFKYELLNRNKGEIPFAVMEHNAGYPAVRRWIEEWKSLGRDEDLEYMIETIPYLETRIFTRRVLTDMIIADAVGIFKKTEAERRVSR